MNKDCDSAVTPVSDTSQVSKKQEFMHLVKVYLVEKFSAFNGS
jgi:hypothetical protein